MNDNDPIKGIIAICEHLATKDLMTQTEFDLLIERMQR